MPGMKLLPLIYLMSKRIKTLKYSLQAINISRSDFNNTIEYILSIRKELFSR